MTPALIPYCSSNVHYLHFGNGSRVLICFHGYGENATSFSWLQKYIPLEYTIIAIDFPFHGATNWQQQTSFTEKDCIAIIDAILLQLAIQERNFVLMGFSMGARVALSLAEKIPLRVLKLILLAPDGLKVNIWYWLATQTWLGNQLFYFTMKHPKWFLWLLATSNQLKLINQSIFKFTRYYIHDKQVRINLFQRWTCMRNFKPNLQKLQRIIINNKLPVRLLYGQHDRIISYERGEKFRRGIELYCEIKILNCGHQVLQEKNADAISLLLTT